jgi:hypothetical protein
VETPAAIQVHGDSKKTDGTLLRVVLRELYAEAIEVAQKNELLVSNGNDTFGFPDPSLQVAIYSLIPISKRPPLHIGRRLWNHYSDTSDKENTALLYLIARQLQQCLSVVDDRNEL